MNTRKLNNKVWKTIENRIKKRLSSWKGKLLLVGGCLVLINSVLSSLPMFMMSFLTAEGRTRDHDSTGKMTNTSRNID
jgi:hypothetical protein